MHVLINRIISTRRPRNYIAQSIFTTCAALNSVAQAKLAVKYGHVLTLMLLVTTCGDTMHTRCCLLVHPKLLGALKGANVIAHHESSL